MKPLEQLNNIERAQLLHKLVPGAIMDFIDFAKNWITYTGHHKRDIEATWDNQLITFNAWFELTAAVEQRINTYGVQLAKSSRLFSEQLFDGHTSLWSNEALLKFASQPNFSHPKFAQLVQVFFVCNPKQDTPIPIYFNRYKTLAVNAFAYIQNKVTEAKKIVLFDPARHKGNLNTFPQYGFLIQAESVVISEMQYLEDGSIMVNGIFTGDHYPQPAKKRLDELDGELILALADYLCRQQSN